LTTYVKVKEDWRDRPGLIREYGYEEMKQDWRFVNELICFCKSWIAHKCAWIGNGVAMNCRLCRR
jgi:hypothetical protein